MAFPWIFSPTVLGIIAVVLGINGLSSLTNYKQTTVGQLLKTPIKPPSTVISTINTGLHTPHVTRYEASYITVANSSDANLIQASHSPTKVSHWSNKRTFQEDSTPLIEASTAGITTTVLTDTNTNQETGISSWSLNMTNNHSLITAPQISTASDEALAASDDNSIAHFTHTAISKNKDMSIQLITLLPSTQVAHPLSVTPKAESSNPLTASSVSASFVPNSSSIELFSRAVSLPRSRRDISAMTSTTKGEMVIFNSTHEVATKTSIAPQDSFTVGSNSNLLSHLEGSATTVVNHTGTTLATKTVAITAWSSSSSSLSSKTAISHTYVVIDKSSLQTMPTSRRDISAMTSTTTTTSEILIFNSTHEVATKTSIAPQHFFTVGNNSNLLSHIEGSAATIVNHTGMALATKSVAITACSSSSSSLSSTTTSSHTSVVIDKSLLQTTSQSITWRSVSDSQDRQTENIPIHKSSNIIFGSTTSLKSASLISMISHPLKSVLSQSTSQDSNKLVSKEEDRSGSEMHVTIATTDGSGSKSEAQTATHNFANGRSLRTTITHGSLTQTTLPSFHTKGSKESISVTPMVGQSSPFPLPSGGNGSSDVSAPPSFTKGRKPLESYPRTVAFSMSITTSTPKAQLNTSYNLSAESKTLNVVQTLNLSTRMSLSISHGNTSTSSALSITSLTHTITSSGVRSVIRPTTSSVASFSTFGSSLPTASFKPAISYSVTKTSLISKMYQGTDILSQVYFTVPSYNISLPNILSKTALLERTPNSSDKLLTTEVYVTRVSAPVFTSFQAIATKSILAEAKTSRRLLSSSNASASVVTSIYQTEENIISSSPILSMQSPSRMINDSASKGSVKDASDKLTITQHLSATTTSIKDASSSTPFIMSPGVSRTSVLVLTTQKTSKGVSVNMHDKSSTHASIIKVPSHSTDRNLSFAAELSSTRDTKQQQTSSISVFTTSSQVIKATELPFGSVRTNTLPGNSIRTSFSTTKETLDSIRTQSSPSQETPPFTGRITSSIGLDRTKTFGTAATALVATVSHSTGPPPVSPKQFDVSMVLKMTWTSHYEYSYTPEFQALASKIKSHVTTVLIILDGFLSLNVLRFWKGSVGVDLVVFVKNSTEVSEDIVERTLIEANNSGVLDLPLTNIQVQEREATTSTTLATTLSTKDDKSIERWIIILIVSGILVFSMSLIICSLLVKLTKQRGGLRGRSKYQVTRANGYLSYLYTDCPEPGSKPVILRMEERRTDFKDDSYGASAYETVHSSSSREGSLSHKDGSILPNDYTNSDYECITNDSTTSSTEKRIKELKEDSVNVRPYTSVSSDSIQAPSHEDVEAKITIDEKWVHQNHGFKDEETF